MKYCYLLDCFLLFLLNNRELDEQNKNQNDPMDDNILRQFILFDHDHNIHHNRSLHFNNNNDEDDNKNKTKNNHKENKWNNHHFKQDSCQTKKESRKIEFKENDNKNEKLNHTKIYQDKKNTYVPNITNESFDGIFGNSLEIEANHIIETCCDIWITLITIRNTCTNIL